MAEEFIPVHEKDLGALASGRIAAKVRAVDDQGHSVNLTPAQLATMSGIDYSILTEQETGEVWITPGGQSKKVYARTWRGTTPATWSTYASGQPYSFKYFILPASNFSPSAVWLEVGMIGLNAEGIMLNTLPLKNATSGATQLSYSDYLGGIVISNISGAGLENKPYSITVKYVK